MRTHSDHSTRIEARSLSTVSMELLHDAFVQQSHRWPERVALAIAGRTLTYRQLRLRSRALALELIAREVGPGAVVGVCAERSIEMVVALLAVLQAGAAYLPLDPADPVGRRKMQLVDARPLLLLADESHAQIGAETGTTTLVLAPEDSTTEPWQPPGRCGRRPDPDDLAYLIYTSGSTGAPKGVMCTHAGIVNRLQWMQRRFSLGAEDRVLQKASIGFDVSLWELFWPLSVGARLVLALPGEQAHPEALAETMLAQGVTVAHFVPAALMGLIRAGGLERCCDLRAVMCSGEAMTVDLHDRFFAVSKAELHNLYGPTEASVDVTHHACGRADSSPAVPIGRAIDRVDVRVLDERLNPVPDGEVGEICISGVALARGYMGRPGLTAQRFAPDPNGGGARLYRTGDRGSVDCAGRIVFVGRGDDQVKVRGVRIELGEVEAMLTSVDGVRSCAVLLDDGDPPSLHAYVTGDLLAPQSLRTDLARRLPSQAVPARITCLDSMPRLPSGKVDRGTLRQMMQHPRAGVALVGDLPSSWDAAFDSAERCSPGLGAADAAALLARIWRVVLDLEEEPKAAENFFTLGGDSIRSIEVVAHARAAGLHLSTADVFVHQSLGDLARHARSQRPGRGPHDAVLRSPFELVDVRDRGLMPEGVCDAMPLTSLLAGLVAESRENPQYLVYTTTLSLEGAYDRQALQAALAAVVDRHSSLRSAVVTDDFSEPLQLVFATVAVSVSEVDARALAQADWVESFGSWLAAERRRGFKWSQPPLLRLTVHRRAGHLWQLTLSEPFLDGWSATVTLAELLRIYGSLLREEPHALPPAPASSNHDLAVGERAALASPEQCVFWKRYLADAPAGGLSKCAEDAVSGQQRLAVPISAMTSNGLKRLARDLGVPLKSILLAAHVWVLDALSGQSEVMCGLMVNRRPEEHGAERAVGLFLNTVPLRVRVEPGSWTQLIWAAQAGEAQILRWRHYPYASMRRWSGRPVLFDSVFNFTHFRPYAAFAQSDSRHGVRLLTAEGSDQTYFPLTAQFSLSVSTERVQLALEADTRCLAASHVEQLADLHRRALSAIANRPAALHHREQLIGRRERSRRARWKVRDPHPRGEPMRLEEMFARQAEKTPDSTAVFDRHERLTYCGLAARADVIAEAIRVNCEVPLRVGVCVERSVHLPVAVLAALRVGAAFVPIDPTMPPKRLEEAIAVLKPQIVVVDAAGAQAFADSRTAASQCLRIDALIAVELQARPGESVLRSVDDPAHILCTSGSTGTPKGVVSTHAALVNRLHWMWRTYPFCANEVACVRGSIGFVDSVTDLFSGLLCGIPTYLVPEETLEPDAFACAVGAAGVTRLTLVPSLLLELLAGCDASRRSALSRINHWVLSGEPLSGELVAQLRGLLPAARVLNLYGSTEVAGDVTVHECEADEPELVSAGRAIDGVRVRVLDRHGRDLPTGAIGEIAVEGHALAVGYLDAPRMTAERMRPSPLGVGQRLFRTGDRGRLTPDGQLETLGRCDRQVKVNGVRVEPAEIESTLLTHPAVRACVALALPAGADRGAALIAYAEVEGEIASGTQLRSFLRARLPSAMVPGRIVVTAALPRTANGKVDVRQLAAEPAVRSRTSGSAPSTAVERAILALAAAELRIDALGLGDDFFERGGDSLAAVRLLSRLRDRFEVRVRLRDIFDHPRLSDLCSYVELAISRQRLRA